MSRIDQQLRYVVLRHEAGSASQRPLHWDLMIEVGVSLRTWALASEPVGDVPIAAEALAPHRLAYLDFEGPIAGDRGTVTQWDRGTYCVLEETENRLVIDLSGERLRGTARLERQAGSTDHWVLRLSSGSVATSG